MASSYFHSKCRAGRGCVGVSDIRESLWSKALKSFNKAIGSLIKIKLSSNFRDLSMKLDEGHYYIRFQNNSSIHLRWTPMHSSLS